ncbi:LolA-like protein [Pararhodonellum marinum]|uniref:peptidase, M16 family protein n=1 Tax=Pararhodonellum marinum TaxID=2755358 RepID=UPI00188F5C01|nr:peptidase, M16 family protein [Pararhodonellum marinum]
MKLHLICLFSAFLIFSGVDAMVSNHPQDEVTLAGDPEVDAVIEKYIESIGGKSKVDAVKNVSLLMTTEIQGMQLEIRTISDSENGRMIQETTMDGNTISQTILNGDNGKVIAMGNPQNLSAEQVKLLRPQTYVFPEQHYESLGYSSSYGGTEQVNGEEAHKIVVKTDGGQETNDYYSVASGLKIKTYGEVLGEVTYSDYQEVEGILMPMTMTINNPMVPATMIGKVTEVKINVDLDDSMFE